jgi:hypothetical protein
MSNRFGVTPDPYSIFNPPDYWTQMVRDPTQVNVQTYPYGGGGYSPYGPYPGFYLGARTMDYQEAQRQARLRHQAMISRAETSEDPSHKYLTAEGRLAPQTAAALRAAKMAQKRQEDPMKNLQKRVIMTILFGSIISALLK